MNDTLQVTADLVEDTDLFDPVPQSAFRRFSPNDVGAIGQPSPSLYSRSGKTHFHTSKMSVDHSGTGQDDLDLAALIASAHRYHEAEKEKSRWAAGGHHINGNDNGPMHAMTTNGFGSPNGHGNGYGHAHGHANGLHNTTSLLKGMNLEAGAADRRWGVGVEWDRASAPMYQPPDSPIVPLTAPISTPAPKSAPIYPYSSPRLSNNIPNIMPIPNSPLSARQPTTPPADVHAQISHHLGQLKALITPALATSEECDKLKKEVEMWKGEWAKVEREKKRLEGVVQGLEERQPRGPGFTAVLIDGDGLIFQDAHLQGGFKGGQEAAKILLSALPTLASQAEVPATSASAGEITLDANGNVADGDSSHRGAKQDIGSAVVMVFLNKSGLGTTLVKAGIIGSWGVFDAFWQGFSSAHELFSVIDVGQGKEATDSKIKEYLKLYSKNAQCEMIVLGASHDNGYANILSSLQTESRLSKLLLLKGYAALAPQLRQYSDRVVSIPDLFRTTKVPMSFSSILQSTPPDIPPPATPSVPQVKNLKKIENADASSSTSETGSEGSMEVFEWSEVKSPKANKGAKANSLAASTASAASPKAKDEWLEAGSHRKGRRYKDDQAAKGGVKGKKGKREKVGTVRNLDPRPCHTYYLSPYGCRVGDECDYGHHYQLDDKQINELAKLAKEMLCPYARTKKCHFDEDECVYGHKCPRMQHCSFGETCRFKVLPNGHGELD